MYLGSQMVKKHKKNHKKNETAVRSRRAVQKCKAANALDVGNPSHLRTNSFLCSCFIRLMGCLPPRRGRLRFQLRAAPQGLSEPMGHGERLELHGAAWSCIVPPSTRLGTCQHRGSRWLRLLRRGPRPIDACLLRTLWFSFSFSVPRRKCAFVNYSVCRAWAAMRPWWGSQWGQPS